MTLQNIHQVLESLIINSAVSSAVIMLSYVSSLVYMTCSWLSKTGYFNKNLANALRLFSLVITGVALTVLMASHVINFALFITSHWVWLVPGLSLWASGFTTLKINNFTGQSVLGPMILVVVCYALEAMFTTISPNLLLGGYPALWHLGFVYACAVLIKSFWGDDYVHTLNRFAERFAKWRFTKVLCDTVKSYDDKSNLVLNMTCGLTISLLNALSLQLGTPQSYIVLMVLLLSITYYFILGCLLIQHSANVRYNYNFVIQTYLNLYNSFACVWLQVRRGVCANVSFTSFFTVLILMLVNTPAAFCMGELPDWHIDSSKDNTGDLSTSSKRLSDQTGAHAIVGPKKVIKTGEAKAVGEGARASKIAKEIVHDTAAYASENKGKLVTEKGATLAALGMVVIGYEGYEYAKAKAFGEASTSNTASNAHDFHS